MNWLPLIVNKIIYFYFDFDFDFNKMNKHKIKLNISYEYFIKIFITSKKDDKYFYP